MKIHLFRPSLLVAICAVSLLCARVAPAAEAKTYQVTGPVLELTPSTITVQKGDERWQINREPGTKVSGDLKVGSKVTIYYRMTATDIEVKPGKAEGKAEWKPEGKKKKTS
jgi:hypothetical protein